MIKKQKSKEEKNKDKDNKTKEMNKAKEALLASKRHTSIMDVSRIDNFGKIWQLKKK